MTRSGSSQPAASNTPSASPVSSKAAPSQGQTSGGAASKPGAKPQQTTPPPPPRAVEAANQVQRVVAQQVTRNPAMAQPVGKPMSPSGPARTSGGKPPNAVIGHNMHLQQQPVSHFQKPVVTNQTGPGPGPRPANMQNPGTMEQWNRFSNPQAQMNAGISNVQTAGVPNIRQVNSLGQLNLSNVSHPQQSANSLGQQPVVQMQPHQQINNQVQPDPALQQLLQLLKNSRQTQDQKKVSQPQYLLSQFVIIICWHCDELASCKISNLK